MATPHELTSVLWAQNRLLDLGSHGAALTSPDGIEWTLSTSGILAEIYSLVWSGSQRVAIGNLQGPLAVMTSPQEPSNAGLLRMSDSNRACIYTVSGTPLIQVSGGPSRGELEIPSGGLLPGPYVFEARAHGRRVTRTFMK